MRLSFFGDTVLDKPYRLNFEIDEYIFNLETPLSCDGEPAKFKVNICQEGSHILETFKKAPLGVSLANNHIMDFGNRAFFQTLRVLDAQNIRYFGAGTQINNFNNPLIVEFAGKQIALCGYSSPSIHAVIGDKISMGSAGLELEKVIDDINYLKSKVDFIIIQPHWGIQEVPFPTFEDREIAQKLITSGADLIVGHHAHVIQSYEIYKGKYIFYGLGNFIFPDLDIPTRWNGEEFTARRVKKQEVEHRTSLVVTIDEKFQIDFFTTLLQDGEVRRVKAKIPKWLPNSNGDFQRRLALHNKAGMLKRFIRNPKIPNMGHFRELLGV